MSQQKRPPAKRPPAKRPPVKRGGRPPVLLFALIGVAVLGLAAFLATQVGGDGESGGRDASTETARVRVRGDALPPLAGDDPAVGMRAPQLRGTVLGGRGSLRVPAEQAKIVMFLAHWCPHCQAEVPVITDWLEDNGAPEGVELYAVSTGVDENQPNYPPSEWLADEGWPVRTLADDANGTAAQAYGVSAYPFFVVTDVEGNVVVRTSGELSTDQLEALVASAGGAAGE